MSIEIPFADLRSASNQLKRTGNDIEDGLAPLMVTRDGQGHHLPTGPTMKSVLSRTPGVLTATGERLGEHVRDFSRTVKDAADKSERLDRQVGGQGGG